MHRWGGRVALVTGALGGIGASITKRLVKHGMKVVGCDRNLQNVQDIADKLKGEKGSLLPIKCNLRQEKDILSMFEEINKQYGCIDVCINNAGLGQAAPLISGETEKWREMFEVNVLALSICTREAIQSMKARGIDDGHIIHINSLAGHTVLKSADTHMYSASKHAVTALTEGLRMELRQMESNIRITSVSPAVVKTEFAMRMRGEQAGREYYNTTPYIFPEDVTDAIIYTLSAPPHVQIHDIQLKATTTP